MANLQWQSVTPVTLLWVGSSTDDPTKSSKGVDALASGLESVMTAANSWSVQYAANSDLELLKTPAAIMYDQVMPCMADGSMPGGVLAVSYIAKIPGEWLATDDAYRYIATSIYNVYPSGADAVNSFSDYIINRNGRGVDSQVMGLNVNESLTYRIYWGTLSN